jgi:hypothetical protein
VKVVIESSRPIAGVAREHDDRTGLFLTGRVCTGHYPEFFGTRAH